jgi:hypothetical protein
MERVSSTLTLVPATSATTPGVCGSQHPAAMAALGSSLAGTAPITLGAPACAGGPQTEERTLSAGATKLTHKHTQPQRASTPQMRKPASSTVARPRPPCTGQSTLGSAPKRERRATRAHKVLRQRAHCSMELSPAANSTTCSRSGCARLAGSAASARARPRAQNNPSERRRRRTPRAARCWPGSATATRGGPCLARARRQRASASAPWRPARSFPHARTRGVAVAGCQQARVGGRRRQVPHLVRVPIQLRADAVALLVILQHVHLRSERGAVAFCAARQRAAPARSACAQRRARPQPRPRA